MKKPHGILLVDKPAGPTSASVMREVQRRLNASRAGHAGTLDPMATGLLVLLLGEATKLSPWAMAEDKLYEATVTFGEATDTLDALGQVVDTADVPDGATDLSRLRPLLGGLTGDVLQIPPAYSAIKTDGRTHMSRARAGEDVKLVARSVRCHSLELTAVTPRTATLLIACGKGFYVRSLARDLGGLVGLPSHLSALRRLAVGGWSVEGAVSPEDVSLGDVLPMGAGIPGVAVVAVDELAVEAVFHGRPVPRLEDHERAILVGPNGVPLAMAVDGGEGHWKVQRGFRFSG